MIPIKVLIVDDSAIARQIIAEILRQEKGIQVVGFCQDGTEVPSAIDRLQPDLITLDVEMPNLNGPSLLKHVLAKRGLPVIMVSGTTAKGAQTTMECLALGAADFILKPAGAGTSQTMKNYALELVEKVLAIGRSNQVRSKEVRSNALCHRPKARQSNGSVERSGLQSLATRARSDPKLIVIGASTGGPGAVEHLLSNLANATPPILVVIHMPMPFTQLYAERLNKRFEHLEVQSATHNSLLQSGNVYIAPGNQHLEVTRNEQGLMLCSLKPVQVKDIYRPSIDRLFISAAKLTGSATLACVLTGMGRDGALGSQAIFEQGGLVFAQDQASSIVYGMPRVVADEGYATMQLDLRSMAKELSNHLQQRCLT